jgi:hypothetical protein
MINLQIKILIKLYQKFKKKINIYNNKKEIIIILNNLLNYYKKRIKLKIWQNK